MNEIAVPVSLIVCVTIVLVAIIVLVGRYLQEYMKTYKFKKRWVSSFLKGSGPVKASITLITEDSKVDARNVKCSLMDDMENNKVYVSITGQFDRDELTVLR